MSVLELLDTITGAHNNWVDGIKNDDPTFIGQIKGDLHLFSVGMASGTIFGKLGAYVLEGGTVGELAIRIAPSLEVFGMVGLAADFASGLVGIGIALNKYNADPTAANLQAFTDAVGKLLIQSLLAYAVFALGAGFVPAAVTFGLVGLAIDLLDTKNLDSLLNFFDKVPDLFHLAMRDPIILDLNGDGIQLTSLAGSSVHFDYAGDGFAERTGWVSPNDGILAIDLNGNGKIDDGLELFGSPTQDGFAILEKLDTNADGVIDALDAGFDNLLVWRDLNQNGMSDSGELQSLAEAGIASISLHTQKLNGTNAGNSLGYEATFTRTDATTGTAETVYFNTDNQDTVDNTPEFTPSSDALEVPQLPGSGLIASIAYKATNDPAFLADWTALTDAAPSLTPAELKSQFEQLLLRWAGVDGVDPASRGPYVDARHLTFLERFYGDDYRISEFGEEVSSYPTDAGRGDLLEAAFQAIVSVYEVAFLAQVAQSGFARDTLDASDALRNPYFFYCLLDFTKYEPGDPAAPDTPGNLGMVVDFIVAMSPVAIGDKTAYLIRALSGLDGAVEVAFEGDRQAYEAAIASAVDGIDDGTIHDIASHIIDGTARFGTTGAEGLNGTVGQDVFIGGGGGDVESGGAGSDIYVYEKQDGDLWVRDDGPVADTDRLVLTDLNAADVSFVRIGDSLLIKVTETGKTVTVESFFANNGIDVLRFADGTEWNRAQIKDASVYQGDGHANSIIDSALNDVIRGGQGDDYIRIGAGNDTVLYSKGDGYDIIDDSSTSTAEHDKFVLTDLNSSDVELSRVGSHLILTVKATGEYVDFQNFFPSSTGDWNTTARNIDELRFADGVSWNRAEIQQRAWYRGTDRTDTIQASELNDTIEGGNGDDILEGWSGSDTFIWRKGDGNDQISDASSKVGNPSNSDVDTLWLQDVEAGDVSYSYQGQTLLLTINSTGEILTIANFLSGVTDLTTGAGANEYGIDLIKFADGTTIDRQQITYDAGAGYLGWDMAVFTWVFQGAVIWQYFVDEFGHAGNIVGNQRPTDFNDIWNASSYGGLGGTLGTPLDLHPSPFHGEGKNILNGADGNDILGAGGAQDVLKGGKGNDILFGDDGNDIIDGEGDDDTLYGGDGMDLMYGGGGAGTDYLSGGAGKDYMSASEGNDTFVGGTGDDVIISNDAGRTGSDTFIYSRGDGNDLIFESGSQDSAADTDVLVLTDIETGDVELARSGDDLLITVKSTQETITVVSHFQDRGSDNNVAGNGLEFIRFADNVWDRAQIQQAAWIRGTDGRDVLSNTTTNAQLNDTFVGGKGNDVIFAGRGSDTFIYASGDGSDVINDATNVSVPNATDKLKFTDLDADDVELSRSGNDLMIKVLATGAVITVIGQFSGGLTGADVGLELIEFADGATLGRAHIQQQAWFRGTDGRDFFDPQSTRDDTFEGGAGDDIIHSGFQSSSGNDTFVYSRGDGNDVIREQTWNSFSSTEIDTLKLTDIDSSDIQLIRSGDDLLVKVLSTNETITVLGQFGDGADAPGMGLEYIEFANGDRWGRDTIASIAASSSPFIAGTNGNDTLIGSAVAQNIYGEAGDDTLDGQGGSDLLYGGLGNDHLVISVSNAGDLVTVDGGVGTDTLDLSGLGVAAWVDLVTNGAEVRTTDQADLNSGTWRDVADVARVENVTGTAFADQISGDAGNNILIGGDGDDILDARSGDDIILAGAGADTLTGGMGADRLDGGEGADIIYGGLGADTLIGGAGNDTLTGGSEGDVFLIGAGAGSDTITDFAAGSVTDHDVIRFDRAVFGDFASVLAAATQSGSDVVIALGGGESLTLQNVDLSALTADNFEFRRLDNQAPSAIAISGGTVTENSTQGTVIAVLTAIDAGDTGTHTFSIVGDDPIFEIIGNEVQVKDGAVVNFETGPQHQLNVQAIDDDGLSVMSTITINIIDQTETLTGTAGNDALTAGGGADILIGGAGNDVLTGGAGSDEYRYDPGDGRDRIADMGGSADTDKLVLGSGIDPSSVTVARSSLANSDVVLVLATGETIVLQGQLSGNGAGLEEIRFADNTVWSRSDILSRLDSHLIVGSTGTETLAGSGVADTFVAGIGDETLSGYGGGDTYRVSAGAGNAVIVEGSESGTDRIELVGLNRADVRFTRSSNDLVITIVSTGRTVTVISQFGLASAGVEEIAFADGSVWDRSQIANNAATTGTAGGETVTGTPGDDVLQPGAGNDVIQAGAGSDTVIYGLGDGSDTINDGVNSLVQTDVLRFLDLNAADVMFSRSGSNLLIKVLSNGDTITVQQQFTSATDFWGIEQVQFADGTVWDKAAISAAAWIRGTSAAETVSGTSDADTIDGQAGNDTLRGYGNDDTYIYALGSGNDTIDENSSDAGTDVIKLVGLNSSDVLFSRSGNDLLIQINLSGETLKVLNQFNGTNGIEQIAFADGTTWDRSQIFNASPVRGTAGNDSFYGSADAEVFDGGAGNDYLHGGGGGDTYLYGVGSGNDNVDENSSDSGTDAVRLIGLNSSDVLFSRSGNDLLIQINSSGETLKVTNQFSGTNGIEQVVFADGSTWNRGQIFDAAWVRGTSGNDSFYGSADAEVFDGEGGNDYLHGGGSGDTYIYGIGSGNDTVDENSGDSGTDIIKLVGLNSSNVLFSRSGNDLFIQINSSGETLKVTNQFNGTNGIEQVLFDDGTVWDRTQISEAAWVRGTAGAETLNGNGNAETFDGGGGNDTLRGYGNGDTYIYSLGSGNDTVDENSGDSGTDIITLVGLNASDVLFSRSGNDLFVQINASGETLKVVNQFNGANGIEQVVFGDGTVWDRTQIADAAWVRGTSGVDTLNGNGNAETFDGGGGNDTLRGYGSGDTYIYSVGSGNDTISEYGGDTGNDVVKLTSLNASDVEFSRISNDLFIKIIATSEVLKVENQFNGTNGIEQVLFGDGTVWDRTQIADAAWVRGTSGADTLNGNGNAETFDGRGGNDTLRGYGNGDTYIYALGSGNDTVEEYSGDAGTDVIKLAGLNSADVLFSRSGNDLFVQINASGETLKVSNQFNGTNGVEQFVFADGTTWDRPAIASAAWYRGTSGNDTISGSSSNDTIAGGGGNDTMSGGTGNDTFVFQASPGQDIVTDFTPGQDVLEFRDGIFADAADALAAATASGNNTVITIDANNSVLLQNVSLANLNETDFHIV
ncbi:calcium-binding protein [Bradyrhizobium sp.]|uniref:calcium-binding protein n=1 Tax=Bradyrhizobium sp. TaxID=376 RepID=UPI0040383403